MGELWPGGASVRAALTPGRPVVLAAVQDSPGSLAALLLAVDIAVTRGAVLHVVTVRHRARLSAWVALTPIPVPPAMINESESEAVRELRAKVEDVLELCPPVDWVFTAGDGRPRSVIEELALSEHPIAVVLGPPRRRVRVEHSLARQLIGRPNIPTVITPA